HRPNPLFPEGSISRKHLEFMARVIPGLAATYPFLSADLIREIAHLPEGHSAGALALHPNTPEDVLVYISKMEAQLVVFQALARRPGLPEHLVKRFIIEGNDELVCCIVRNKKFRPLVKNILPTLDIESQEFISAMIDMDADMEENQRKSFGNGGSVAPETLEILPRRQWRRRNPGVKVIGEEIDLLVAIEQQIGKMIPHIRYKPDNASGFTATRGHVTKLYLYQQGMMSLPDAITRMAWLQVLDLRNNQLTVLPESIGDLTNLEELILSNNQLSSLPETIGQLTSLKTLDLSSNKLSSLPETIGNLRLLRELYLYDINLSFLPETIRSWLEDLKKIGCEVII
ncbi:MAG: leucine-rich repeat domain-containing protein, partial [Candidatus Sigynarchaeota archaeon]